MKLSSYTGFSFTAAQAAQKYCRNGDGVQNKFTAAQAAQKKSRSECGSLL